jgi:hypothetical protein
MNVIQALIALERGYKISHRSFTNKEWVRKFGERYLFEDDTTCTPCGFWSDRCDDCWLQNWGIYGD